MYLREGRIRALKVKNVILVIVGVFLWATAVWSMTDLVVHYFGDWETVLYARRTPECAVNFMLGILLTVISRRSRTLINDATFFSRYFEGDLSGYVSFEELAEVTGRTAPQVRRRLKLLRALYMKRFQFSRPEGGDGEERVELYSKTVTCTCRSCGGAMEKRIYFTGECPYCGSSDLTARVLSGQRFYCISDDENRRVNDPTYYQGRNLRGRMLLIAIGLGLAAAAVIISLAMFLDYLSKINDQDYLTKLLLSGWHHRSSFELIQGELRDMMLFDVYVALTAGSAIPVLLTRAVGVRRALVLSQFFSRVSTPFVAVSDLSRLGRPRRVLRCLVSALREGYLKGCAPERHGGPLRIGLSKRIVKDRCPTCAAPITGAVDENYTCQYCGNRILEVIRKG